jgi:hypothetical protein
MSQHDMNISNANGATVRADINLALQALASSSKGSSRPSTAYAGQVWLNDSFPSSTIWTLYLYDGSNDIEIGLFDTVTNFFTPPLSALSLLLGSSISGLGLTVNASDPDHDIDIAAGSALDSSLATFLGLSSGLTKRIDASWAAGTAAGGLFSGTVANNTTYHVFIIRKDSDGSIDAGFDTSVTAANIPSGYTAYRRIGSIRTNGSANIIKFFQTGDRFIWDVMVGDINAVNPGTSAVTRTLTVPTGIVVEAIVSQGVQAGTSTTVRSLLTALKQADTAPSGVSCTCYVNRSANTGTINSETIVETNTSGQIRSRLDSSGASDALYIATIGWIDRRAI